MTHLGDLLSAYLDGELAPDEHNQVVSHLAACDRCQLDLRELHDTRAAVRGLPTLEAPTWLLVESVNDASARRHPVRIAAAVAAALLISTAGVATWLSPTPELTVDFVEIATPHRVLTSQDGPPTGARLVQIAPYSPAGAE